MKDYKFPLSYVIGMILATIAVLAILITISVSSYAAGIEDWFADHPTPAMQRSIPACTTDLDCCRKFPKSCENWREPELPVCAQTKADAEFLGFPLCGTGCAYESTGLVTQSCEKAMYVWTEENHKEGGFPICGKNKADASYLEIPLCKDGCIYEATGYLTKECSNALIMTFRKMPKA